MSYYNGKKVVCCYYNGHKVNKVYFPPKVTLQITASRSGTTDNRYITLRNEQNESITIQGFSSNWKIIGGTIFDNVIEDYQSSVGETKTIEISVPFNTTLTFEGTGEVNNESAYPQTMTKTITITEDTTIQIEIYFGKR